MNGAGNGDGRRIRSAAAQSRNIAMLRNPLKTGDDNDIAVL